MSVFHIESQYNTYELVAGTNIETPLIILQGTACERMTMGAHYGENREIWVHTCLKKVDYCQLYEVIRGQQY